MADASDKSAESAEKAYAEAAAEAKPVPPIESKAVTSPAARGHAETAQPRSTPERAPAVKKTKKAPAKKEAPKPQAAQPVARPVSVPQRAAVAKPASVAAPVAAPVPVAESVPETFAVIPTITELKEKIMATTAKTPDFTKPMADAFGEMQTRAKAAYEKGTETVAEITEFTKGNVEALVESGKILAGGVQDLGKTYVDEAKSAYETLTADIKEAAAVKSPTELFQLQGKIFRRNFDSLVATSSKNTEAMIKLANEAFAPLSGRVNLATEKLSKVA